MTRLTLVGEANPHSDDPWMALFPLPRGCAGDRLRRLLGLSRTQYLVRFDRVNLCGRHWSSKTSRRRAQDLRASGGHLILLGRRVAGAFGVEADYLAVVRDHPCVFYLLPHPSGLNRWWNDERNCDAARAFLSRLSKLATEE